VLPVVQTLVKALVEYIVMKKPFKSSRLIDISSVKSSKGFTLIEILVSIIIISIGLLGVAGLQTVTLRQNYNSHLLTQASFQANDMIERMRANMVGVKDGAYDNVTGAESNPSCFPNCTPDQLAQYDANVWMTTTKSALNDGGTGNVTGTVASNADDTFTIDIKWNEPALPGQVDENGDRVNSVQNTYVLRFKP